MVEAKDTVNYSVEEINGTTFLPPDYISWREHINLMKAQAEISFRAGEEKGRKEVVEWIEVNNQAGLNDTIYFLRKTLQAQLKEWGL